MVRREDGGVVDELVARASEVRAQAHAPYSGFAVGAVIEAAERGRAAAEARRALSAMEEMVEAQRQSSGEVLEAHRRRTQEAAEGQRRACEEESDSLRRAVRLAEEEATRRVQTAEEEVKKEEGKKREQERLVI